MPSPTDSSLPLIALSPSDVLVFSLEKNVSSKTTLRVSNISQSYVAFKVKTTQPTWYFVKPNQYYLSPGHSEDVSIVLLDTESNRILQQLVKGGEKEKGEKHRFLVQSRALTEDEYRRISESDSQTKGEELSKVWESAPKDDKRSIKLKVDFQIASSNATESATPIASKTSASFSTSSASTSNSSSSSTSDGVESKGPAMQSSSTSTPMPRMKSEQESLRSQLLNKNPPTSDSSLESPAALRSELETLSKRFDAVVEYTVHLTAERDSVVAQLEEAQRELSKEISKKRPVSGAGVGVDAKSLVKGEKSDKKGASAGYSLFVVILAAFFSFLIGRYFHN